MRAFFCCFSGARVCVLWSRLHLILLTTAIIITLTLNLYALNDYYVHLWCSIFAWCLSNAKHLHLMMHFCVICCFAKRTEWCWMAQLRNEIERESGKKRQKIKWATKKGKTLPKREWASEIERNEMKWKPLRA